MCKYYYYESTTYQDRGSNMGETARCRYLVVAISLSLSLSLSLLFYLLGLYMEYG